MDYRTKCIIEKGHCCHKCLAQDDIEVHHINGDRLDNRLENLMPLCHDCHMAVHNSKRKHSGLTRRLKGGPMGGEVSEEMIDDAFANSSIS